MRDITNEPTTLRSATAVGRVQLSTRGAELVREGRIVEGDLRERARMAALMAVKFTPFVVPHRHPIPVLDTTVELALGDETMDIEATVRTIAATGVALEALSAVSAAALCIYDVLAPHLGDALVVEGVRLRHEKGGRSQYRQVVETGSAAVVVLSDSVAAGTKPDTAGRSVVDGLDAAGFDVIAYDVLPDDPPELTRRIRSLLDAQPDLIVTVGGTGLGPRDRTVEAVQPMFTTELPGLMEAARSFGQARTPYAMLSRGVAGLVGSTLVATFPGSRRGAEETLAAVLPGIVHLIEVLHITRPHEGGYT